MSQIYNVVVMHVIFLVLCILGVGGKPSFTFDFPTLSSLNTNGREIKLKRYSGARVDKDSLRMVYVNDQTVAVVELGPKKLLLNCELIEILEEEQISEVLGEFKSSARPMPISFDEMRTLMNQCMQLQSRKYLKSHRELHKNSTNRAQERALKNPFTLLNGIIPGTKWCGTGDIARDYFDLGAESTVDMCCRAHDLCPIKIRAYSQKYNLTNNSLYTKSHCSCDDDFFDCLKKSKGSATANIMGNIYFNLVQVPCLEGFYNDIRFRSARKNF
ncbi:phospholipase A2 hemilipin [Diorhabda carinulata]|uniref:phospholipase A2 hemilipin n=1 Tax=Diorhabda carinulata TaxID=1163345 RepID=UPI0025A19E4F|nr:phospholipase A2 hemilipin [Diorhabda carinulata]